MSAIDRIDSGKPLPRLANVICVDGQHRIVSLTWLSGSRAGRTETVDLSPLIDTHKFYAPLRKNAALFATVHIINDGGAIAWGNDDIDMGAPSIERLARESMTADDFRAFLDRNKFTQDVAAAWLGSSKRSLAYYLEQGVMPRWLALACVGLEVQKREYESFKIFSQVTSVFKTSAAMGTWHATLDIPPQRSKQNA